MARGSAARPGQAERGWPERAGMARAQRALAILDEWRPDLALVDILVPDVDGWASSRIVRRHRIPVLFVSRG